MFDKVGQVVYPLSAASEEAMFEAVIEAGADNCVTGSEAHDITCAPESLGAVRDALAATFGDPVSSKIIWLPKNTVPVGEEQAMSLIKLIDALEDFDDVQNVYANFEVSDDVMKKLSA